MLKENQWTAKAFLTFMSRPEQVRKHGFTFRQHSLFALNCVGAGPEQGHIRIVHFNRDKPWAGARKLSITPRTP